MELSIGDDNHSLPLCVYLTSFGTYVEVFPTEEAPMGFDDLQMVIFQLISECYLCFQIVTGT